LEDKKVFKFLRTFSKRQLNRFEDYLNSPYFNKSEELCFIYDVVKKYVLSSSPKSFQEYFKSQLPSDKKPISATNLDKYLSRIFHFALDFVAIEEYKKDEFLKQSLLMDHLIEKDELNMFDKFYNKSKNSINKEKLSYPNLLKKYLLERQKANYLSVNSINRKGKQNLQETSDALDQFYLTQKFNIELLKLNREENINEKFDYHLIKEISNGLSKNTIKENFLLNMLHNAYEITTIEDTNKKEVFEEIADILITNASYLNDTIVYNMGQLLTNLVWKIFKVKDDNYYHYLFKLNRRLLNKGILQYQGNIFAPVFKNLVDVAIRVNKLDWCKNFIENFSKNIIPNSLAFDISNYANARVKFYSKNYEGARSFIQTLKFNDIYYKMAVRRLEIMVYYELKEYLYLESLINSFRVALTPQRLSQLKKQNQLENKTFLIYASKLLNMQQTPNHLKSNYLKNMLKEFTEENMPHQLWFNSKIQEAIEQYVH